jgi:hypothetical protein
MATATPTKNPPTTPPSNLSAPAYGYDFVVATTQASINETMKKYLSTLSQPQVTMCYVADDSGNAVYKDHNELMQLTGGVDPFLVPPNASSHDMSALMGARFMGGFIAKLGLPAMPDPSALPDIVVLGINTAAVTFNMLCSEFTVVQLTPGSGYVPTPSWFTATQQPGAPWIYTANVDLRQSKLDNGAYSSLPPAVQAKIHNMGATAFSVQQLLFDLTNARLQSIPTIKGVAPGSMIETVLQKYFCEVYFDQMQKDAQPLLNTSIVVQNAPPSTMTLTDFNIEVSPYLGSNGLPVMDSSSQQLSTLNYLCAADLHGLPPAVMFKWNWVNDLNYQGVVAINRNTLVNYFRQHLTGFVGNNCFKPSVRVYMGGTANATCEYTYSLAGGQMAPLTVPTTGSRVLSWDYQASADDSAGINGDMGELKCTNHYTMTVDFIDNQIIVTQHQIVYVYVRRLASSSNGNIYDRTITDTYFISVNPAGQLVTTLASKNTNADKDISISGFESIWTGFNTLVSDIKTFVDKLVGTKFQDIPIGTIQNYVFPGGNTFTYNHAAFSSNQDLVSFIQYVDPTQTTTSTTGATATSVKATSAPTPVATAPPPPKLPLKAMTNFLNHLPGLVKI